MKTCADQTVLYLLCFDTPIGRAKHYIGSTTLKCLPSRMARHLQGTGSHLTKAMAQLGSGFTLARIIPIKHRSEERRIKNIGHYHTRCPICSPNPQTQALYNGAVHYAPVPPFHPFGVNFGIEPNPSQNSPHRKRRPALAETAPFPSLVQK